MSNKLLRGFPVGVIPRDGAVMRYPNWIIYQSTITPTLGAELVPTGNAASITSEANALTGFHVEGAGNVLSSVADPRTGSAGSYSFDVQAADTTNTNFGNFGSAGVWYLTDLWLKFTGSVGGYGMYSEGAVRDWPLGNVSTATWLRQFFMFKNTAGSSALRVRGNTTNAHHRIDDYSVKSVTLESCIATPLTTATGDVIASAMVSMDADIHAWGGVMCNIDSVSNIQNCVMLFIDRSKIYLHKIVSGTVTYVTSATIAYVAGAPVQLRKSGNTYKMYYNGAQVGADQTISDVTVVNNTIHAQFAVSPLVTFGGYTLS